MKQIIILLLFIAAFIPAFSQEKRINEKDLPVQIIQYLQQTYPSKKEVEYYKKKEKDIIYFEAEFELNKQEYNLKFSLNGVLLETEREIELDELESSIKQNILTVLSENFAKTKIEKVQEVDPVGAKCFEVNVKVKKHKNNSQYKSRFYKLMFNITGQLLQIEEVKLESIESVF